MRRTIELIVLAVVLAVLAAPAFAQKQDCTDENKAAWYQKFLDNFRGDENKQKVAYEAAKTYLDSCPADPNDAQATYMREKFVKPWEELQKKQGVGALFQAAVDKKNPADQFRYGEQILATDPDNPDVNVILGVVGLSDATLLNKSAQYATKTIALIESGKVPKVYTRDQALAYLHWTVGRSKLASSPADAIGDLLKAAKIESEVKKNPGLYLDLAAAYESGPRAKYSDEYTASLKPDKTETDQSKVILENLNRVIDNQIDAMARAAALTTDAAKKQQIMTELTALYKYRTKSETGVTELVANVLQKPIPDVPAPITQLPSTPTTPTTGSSTGTNGNTTGQNKTGATRTTTTGNKTTSNTGAKPTPTPTPPANRKPPRRAHHVAR